MIEHMIKIKQIDNSHWPQWDLSTCLQVLHWIKKSSWTFYELWNKKIEDALKYLNFCIPVTKMLVLKTAWQPVHPFLSRTFVTFNWMFHTGVSVCRISIYSVMNLFWKSFRNFKQWIPIDCNISLHCCYPPWTPWDTQQLL